jgi:hypothetical protein
MIMAVERASTAEAPHPFLSRVNPEQELYNPICSPGVTIAIAHRVQLVMRESVFHISIPCMLEGFLDSIGLGLFVRAATQYHLWFMIWIGGSRPNEAQHCQRE